MANISYVSLNKEALKVLSSATLTALSNKLTEKSSGINGQIQQLDRRIGRIKNRVNLSNEDSLSLGPITKELNALTLSLESGLTNDQIFSQGNVSSVDLSGVVSNLTATLSEDVNNQISESNIESVNALILERSTAAATLAVIQSDIEFIVAELQSRSDGNSKEPVINYGTVQAQLGALSFSTADLKKLEEHQELLATQIIRPLKESAAAVAAFRAQLKIKDDSDTAPLFDLEYGPPISTTGRYILSKDGLYYDSRTGGIPELAVRGIIAASWKLDYAPNLGGKGIKYDDVDLLEYANTIFSPEYKEENDQVKKLYATDDILQGIEDDRISNITEVSGHITDLIASGYNVSSALVKNYHRSIAGISDAYRNKKFKRQKQLQLAGLFGSFIITTNEFPLGEGTILLPIEDERTKAYIQTSSMFSNGWTIEPNQIAVRRGTNLIRVFEILQRIPINDFSFLNGTGINPTIDTQKKTLLQSEDVNDIILPYQVKFTTSKNVNTIFLKDFTVAPAGVGDWVHVSGDSNVSAVLPFVKSLTDDIVTDGLVVCYNFLKGVVTSPSSTSYILDNEGGSSPAMNGKLVGTAASAVFPSGVAIPYLGGTLYNPVLSENPEPWYSTVNKGSYVRLPNNIKDGLLNRGSSPIDDLTYGDNGFSVESWLHIPSLLEDMNESHQYRVLLGCENTGPGRITGTAPIVATRNKEPLNGLIIRDEDKVHGMLVGFRLKDNYVSGIPLTSSLEFFTAPTVSQNNQNGLWGPSIAIAESLSGYDPKGNRSTLGFFVDATTANEDGTTIGDVSGSFHHLVTVFNYKTDTISVYMDKLFIASSVLSTSFATNPGEALSIPNPVFKELNFNHLNSHGVNPQNEYIESVHEGGPVPAGLPVFTPWIIGGGWSDSIRRSPTLEQTTGATTPLGFLGSNTNDSVWTGALDASGAVVGLHNPSIGGALYSGANRNIPRSGLDGYVGSFKLYNKPLNIKEVGQNYDAQQAFFRNIST